MAPWTDIADRLTDDVEATFGGLMTLTRGEQSVAFRGILDLDARITPVAPSDVPTEGVQPRLDVKIARLGALGRPRHGDRLHDQGTDRDFEVVAVEDGAQGCVSCWLLEVTP